MSVFQKMDGWLSVLTGSGTQRDKVTSYDFQADVLGFEQCEQIWRGDDMGARIVELVPREMLRRGFEINTSDDKNAEENIKTFFKRVEFKQKLLIALQYQRAYGGAAILVGVRGGDPNLSNPINPLQVQSVDWLNVFTPRDLTPDLLYEDPTQANYGKPSTYKTQGSGEIKAVSIHESRLLIFNGIQTYSNRNEWGDSVLNRIWSVLRGFNAARGSIFNLGTTLGLDVYKMAGLADAVARDAGANIQKRMQIIDLVKSVQRSIVVDRDLEDFERMPAPIQGVGDMCDRMNEWLAAAAEMPLTMLFGKSPGGLGSNGDGETRKFYDTVQAAQADILEPVIRKILKLAEVSLKIPEIHEINFLPLWTPSEAEIVSARAAQANADVAYINAGVLYPDEVAQARFGGEKYSFETPVDFVERAKLEQITPDLNTIPQPVGPIDPKRNTVPPVDGSVNQP
jgi:phage-related protein (TIGR01555 family)